MAKLAALREEQRKKELFIDENLKLQPQINNAKTLIENANYDKGQTFDKHLDGLKNSFDSAMLALDKYPDKANKFFKEALKEIEWIKTSVPLRQTVQKLQKQAALKKSEADKFNGSKLAYITYSRAGKDVKKAAVDYESGNFNTAVKLLNAAVSNYEKAYKEARQTTIKNLLETSELSARSNQWQKSFDSANSVLKIDSGNAEAQRLKQEAEKNLKPTLEIIATVDGEQVPAEVKFGNQTMATFNKIFSDFTENNNYKGTLSYKHGEAEYVGEIKFTCNWRGPKKLTVALKKQEFTKIDCNGVVLEMVKIKAGTFTMGSPEGEKGRYNDEKQHQVTLTKDYWLGKFEVTQAQWQAVMGNNPSNFKGDNRPVENVSWNDAKEFCNKLNKKYAGKLPAGYKFDLPTEAQWEYACRAGTTTSLNNGENMQISGLNDSPNLDKVGWYGGNCGQNFELSNGYDISSWKEKQYSDLRGGTHPAGQKRPNNWGLYDMHGNVWEWCRDWYNSNSYSGDATDPVGPSSGSLRVYRGGSWLNFAKGCRSAYRYDSSPGSRSRSIGFRLALVPVQ